MYDWTGKNEGEFHALCLAWKDNFKKTELVTDCGFNTNNVDTVMGAIHRYLTAYDTFTAFNTTDNKNKKNDAMSEAKAAVRDFANTDIRHNKLMSVADKLLFHVRTRDTSMTRHGRPKYTPYTMLKYTLNPLEMEISALHPETGSKVKPEDAARVGYVYQVGGEPPLSAERIGNGESRRGTTFKIQLTEADTGKEVYAATRYLSESGEGGNWSPIEKLTVR